MSFFTGSDGQLILAPRNSVPDGRGILKDPNTDARVEKLIAKVRSWTFTSSTATLDVTSLGDTDRTFREGIRSASGNADIFYYTNTTASGTNVTELIEFQLGERTNTEQGFASDDEPEKFTIKFLMARGTQKPLLPHWSLCNNKHERSTWQWAKSLAQALLLTLTAPLLSTGYERLPRKRRPGSNQAHR